MVENSANRLQSIKSIQYYYIYWQKFAWCFYWKKIKNSKPTAFKNASFEPLYTQDRPITQEKYNDLQKLLEFVPSQFHSFYTSLKYVAEEPNTKLTRKYDDDQKTIKKKHKWSVDHISIAHFFPSDIWMSLDLCIQKK